MVKKTDYRRKRDQRDLKIYADYQKMKAADGAMPTAIVKNLMSKYSIHAASTIYRIVQKVEKTQNP
jgi:ribosomal protein S16